MSGGASPFGQSTGEMDFGLDKRGSFQGAMARNQSPRSQWANTLEAALEEADVQLLFRLDLPLMVKAVADGEIHSLKEVTPPRWNQMKVMAMDFLEELERIGTCRPGQRASLKVVSDLYDCLEEQGCNQGFDALCKSFTFLFGGLEEVQKVLDVNKNGLLSTTEFSMAMCLSGLDLGVICGLDEREIFLAVDVNHSGSISIEELLRFCASKPAETKLSKADRAKKERERKAAAAKSSKSKMNTTAIIEQAGLKVVQEKEVQGVRFQAMVVPKQSSSNLTPSATGAGVGMDVMLEELDEEEIDDMLEVLAQEEILRAQAKWICVSRWLASVLGASSLENEGQERAKTWEDERQQAYDAVEQAVLVPMAAALPAVFTAQDSGAVSGSMEEDASKPTALLAGEELDHQLEKLFQEEATEDGGRKILDRSATRHFFEDLMLADFKSPDFAAEGEASQRQQRRSVAPASQRRSVAASQRQQRRSVAPASQRRSVAAPTASQRRSRVAASQRRSANSVAASLAQRQRRSVAALQRHPPPGASQRRSVAAPPAPGSVTAQRRKPTLRPPLWHQKLRMVILDRLYDDTLNIQKEESGLAKGLTFRSLKVVLHRMLRDHAEHWMESFRWTVGTGAPGSYQFFLGI
ncbi:unnamed protein product [Cladocopium goreaui]|uniref:EF-hand domain-containing protein n=1 Tax=Cladocopium goreaui TaxID=2562237 RepID=A0A9P1BPP7_9DINO|nr:unnamed protein product [Cladocopium goreaui]